MKKALSLTLALVMCLSLIPLTALAYGNDRIQLNKDNYAPEEQMLITIKGITQQMIDDDACVGIFKKGTEELVGPGYDTMHEVGEHLFDWMNAPVESGEYAVVLLSKWWQNGSFDELYVTSVPFTVGKNAQVGNIELDKTAYKAMEPMTVSYSGISEEMLNSKAIVLMYDKSDPGQNVLQTGLIEKSNGTFEWVVPNKNGEFEVRLYTQQNLQNADTFVMAKSFTVSGASNTSGWAQEQNVAEKAAQYGLIPDSLKGADWTKPITRAEFAAVSVKLYESLTDKKATPVATNPFTDTKDPEILKAFNIGVTNGTSATLFSPNALLNRQEAATMLTRALKSAYIPGWTLPTDGDYTLNFTMPAKFADDDKIDGWAKPSVYFMVANKIINGMGDNIFAPKNTTDKEVALSYANATREQALKIAVGIVENLGGKPLDFQQGAASEQPVAPDKPTTPPSGTDTQKLVGHWEATWSGSFGYDNCVFYDTSNVTETYTTPYGRGIHFYADGTFKYVFANAIYATVGGHRNLIANGVTIIRGKYNAVDGKLYMTDMRSSYTPRQNDPSNKEAYADRAEADETWTYKFGDDYVEIAGTNDDIKAIEYYDMTKYPCKEQ